MGVVCIKMRCILPVIVFCTLVAISFGLKCRQCTGSEFGLCNGLEDNGIEVDCNASGNNVSYQSHIVEYHVNIIQVAQYLVRFVGKLDPSIDENISGEIQDV